jgi:cytochrome c-type biogenesis protein CcmI
VTLDPDALAALEEQRSFLRRSLADLEREHQAGDLDEADFTTLRADYRRRLQEVEHAVASGKADLAANRRARPWQQTLAIWVAIVAFGGLVGTLVSTNLASRGQGQEITGAPAVEGRSANISCLDTANNGGPAAAATCYGEILKSDPQNVEALTYLNGFTAMTSDSQDELLHSLVGLLQALELNPDYPDVHAFLAITNYKLGHFQKAQSEFETLDRLNASPLMLQLVATARADTARQLGLPEPTVPGATSAEASGATMPGAAPATVPGAGAPAALPGAGVATTAVPTTAVPVPSPAAPGP